ncbi:MAG: SCO family protein [Bacteroidia bacterium]
MKRKIIILVFLLSLPSILYVVLTTGKHNFVRLPYYGPHEIAENGKDTLYHTIPAFKFVNQNGDTVTDKTFDGKIYVADYFFTTCNTICPQMAVQLLRIQEKFGYNKEQVKILSHTVNPENDSVPVLNAYANMVHADTNMWTFVTGDKKQLYDIARKGYLLNALQGDGGPNDFIHSEIFVLIDKEKHIRGIYDGTKIGEVNRLIDDVKILLAEYIIKETKENKITHKNNKHE